MQAPFNLYRMLQVDPSAEDVVIHAAYRALMKRYHPDRGGDVTIVQRLNAAYATLRDPHARQAYDNLRKTVGAAKSATGGARAPGAGPSLAAELGPGFRRLFAPVAAEGFGWIFDFTGVLRGSPRDRIWMKRFHRADTTDAQGLRTRIEAARLSQPIWRWGTDLFVAVLPSVSQQFRALLRGPRGPLSRLSYAVVALDLSSRRIHAVGRSAELSSVGALISALATSR